MWESGDGGYEIYRFFLKSEGPLLLFDRRADWIVVLVDGNLGEAFSFPLRFFPCEQPWGKRGGGGPKKKNGGVGSGRRGGTERRKSEFRPFFSFFSLTPSLSFLAVRLQLKAS